MGKGACHSSVRASSSFHMLEGENLLLKAVIWPSRELCNVPHGHTHTSTEINKDNKDASSEKSANGGMPCNPSAQVLGDGLWLA